jgi:hypothetical protein
VDNAGLGQVREDEGLPSNLKFEGFDEEASGEIGKGLAGRGGEPRLRSYRIELTGNRTAARPDGSFGTYSFASVFARIINAHTAIRICKCCGLIVEMRATKSD